MKRFFAVLLAAALFIEAIYTAAWFAQRLQIVFAYDWLTIALTFARVGVAIVQFSAASQLASRRPAARPLTRAALLSSAVLMTLEVGFGLASTTILPSQRPYAVAAYWVYAAAGYLIVK